MEYLLNGRIYFDDEKRTLKDESHEVELSVTTTKLLVEMIKADEQQISRAKLLENVWENMGLVASDSNLSRNISLLRKALSVFNNIVKIETIPKQGFILHCRVEVLNEPNSIISGDGGKGNKILWCYISITSLIVSAIIFICIRSYCSKNEVDMIKYKDIGHCEIFLNNKKVSKKRADIFFNTQIGMNILDICKSQNSIVYFDDNKIPMKNCAYTTHVVVCDNEEQGGYNECKNYINNNYN